MSCSTPIHSLLHSFLLFFEQSFASLERGRFRVLTDCRKQTHLVRTNRNYHNVCPVRKGRYKTLRSSYFDDMLLSVGNWAIKSLDNDATLGTLPN